MAFSASGLHSRRFKTGRTVGALMLREMSTTYGRSPGGYIWAILEPVGALTILTLAFSIAFSSPALGTVFPLFYASGYLPFMLYNDLGQKVSTAIRFSKPLLFYPSVTYIDAILARFLLNALTHLLVFVIIIFGIISIYNASVIFDYASIINSLCMAMVLGLGVGTLNCFLLTMFPVWERIWLIINRPLFIISGVFFLFESVPEPYRSIMWFNPLVHVIGEMRNGIYPTYDAYFVSSTYVYLLSLFLLMIGLLFLGRYHRVLLNS